MRVSYNNIFKYSDVLNPVSSKTIFSAGKVAGFNPETRILDLGSGKGYPSLLWASVFGVSIEGFDLNKGFVEYANSRAELLHLSSRVKYVCGDVRQQNFTDRYDVVSSLGLGIIGIYGGVDSALKYFRSVLKKGGFLILAEPVWLVKPVPQQVQEALETPEESLCTRSEMEHLLSDLGLDVRESYVSSKETWERYIRPAKMAMTEMMESQARLAGDCQRLMDGFDAEYNAVGKYWNMVLWVARTGARDVSND